MRRGRGGRRPCGRGGGRGGGPAGRGDRARDARSDANRPNELQSGHRRRREGNRGARSGGLGRRDGARHRRVADSLPHAQPLEGTCGLGAARPVRPGPVPARGAAVAGRAGALGPLPGHGLGPACGRGPAGRDDARRRLGGRAGSGGHSRDLPARAHPCGRNGGPRGRPGRGSAVGGLGPGVGGERPGGRPVQDRHAAAHRRPHGGLRPVRATRRGPAGASLLVLHPRDAAGPAALLDHVDGPWARGRRAAQPRQERAVRRRDRRPGSPVLPVHRGQGGALSEGPEASSLPGARRTRHHRDVRQRPLHVASARGAAGVPADRARPRGGQDDQGRLRHRIRLLSAPPAPPHAGGQDRARPLLRGPDQRHDRVRGGGGTRSGGRRQRRAGRAGAPALRPRTRPSLHRRPDRRFGDQGRGRALPPLHFARRVSAAAAARQRAEPAGSVGPDWAS